MSTPTIKWEAGSSLPFGFFIRNSSKMGICYLHLSRSMSGQLHEIVKPYVVSLGL